MDSLTQNIQSQNPVELQETSAKTNYFSKEYDRIGMSRNFDIVDKETGKSAYVVRPPREDSLRFCELAMSIRTMSKEDRDWMFDFIKSYNERGLMIKINTTWRVSNYGF